MTKQFRGIPSLEELLKIAEDTEKMEKSKDVVVEGEDSKRKENAKQDASDDDSEGE